MIEPAVGTGTLKSQNIRGLLNHTDQVALALGMKAKLAVRIRFTEKTALWACHHPLRSLLQSFN
jgi:hypothetical protein